MVFSVILQTNWVLIYMYLIWLLIDPVLEGCLVVVLLWTISAGTVINFFWNTYLLCLVQVISKQPGHSSDAGVVDQVVVVLWSACQCHSLYIFLSNEGWFNSYSTKKCYFISFLSIHSFTGKSFTFNWTRVKLSCWFASQIVQDFNIHIVT